MRQWTNSHSRKPCWANTNSDKTRKSDIKWSVSEPLASRGRGADADGGQSTARKTATLDINDLQREEE